MASRRFILVLALVALSCTAVLADTPANCSTYEDYLGTWMYTYGPISSTGSAIDCSTWSPAPGDESLTIKLSYPNIVTDSLGNTGNFTTIYNQGVEVWIGDAIWFAFSAWNANTSESICTQTIPGWTHTFSGTQWRCFIGIQQTTEEGDRVGETLSTPSLKVKEEALQLIIELLPTPIQHHHLPTSKFGPKLPIGPNITFTLFNDTDAMCETSLAVYTIPTHTCLAPPTTFTEVGSLLAHLRPDTNEWILWLYPTNAANCDGSSSPTLIYGRGNQCMDANAITPGGSFTVDSPILSFCRLTKYTGDDDCGTVAYAFGLELDTCELPLEPSQAITKWSVEKASNMWTSTEYSEQTCTNVTASQTGSVGVCYDQTTITCASGDKNKIVLAEEDYDVTPSSTPSSPHTRHSQYYRRDDAFLAAVNAAQSWFTVGHYPQDEGLTLAQLQHRRGTPRARFVDMAPPVVPTKSSPHHRHHSSKKMDIPSSFDWRNVNGVNYVSPVRDQGSCGSCFSFASAAMLEARIRIASNNTAQPILAPQDVLSCSPYSQGCEGGFPYLTGGKYAHDYGMTEEDCYPYQGQDSSCAPDPQPGCNPQRWFSNEYYYVGGYYGMSTVEGMQEEIMSNGPIAVSFEVYDDFQAYTGGVYTHQFTRDLQSEFNPFELVNHSVLIVGWGETTDSPPIPYWIVKNSWGTSWGENGFFRILRGSSEAGGECAIESITVSAIPILH